jgi:hypothetical protein
VPSLAEKLVIYFIQNDQHWFPTLSEKLNNPSSRSIEVSTNDKRIEYFPDEKLIVKGSKSLEDPLDVADDDMDIYSDEENPEVKKIANKMVDYTLDNKKPVKEKLKVRRSKIKYIRIKRRRKLRRKR